MGSARRLGSISAMSLMMRRTILPSDRNIWAGIPGSGTWVRIVKAESQFENFKFYNSLHCLNRLLVIFNDNIEA